ncbi:TrfB-related DNA-binding protein [Halomonas sp. 3A7M]|uniref:TrfB-related DNA-binding protein n=1 Tax=Halomonas sp. 3A7M TaxID=2742616 RepID=UPI001869506F|nr:TrfB-related DNA-binding protein [Halomonas sp. 3A7M]
MGLHARQIIRFSEAEWTAAQARLSAFSDNTLALAKQVLVDGLAPPEVARATGVANQTVHTAVKRVKAALEDSAPKDLRLSLDEWEQLQPLLVGFSSKTLDHARRVLVEGASQASVARDAGISRQAVKIAVNRVKAKVAPSQSPGLTPCVVWLPESDIAALAAFAEQHGWKLKGHE